MPHLKVDSEIGIPIIRRNDFAYAEPAGLVGYAADVFHGITPFSLRWSKSRCFEQTMRAGSLRGVATCGLTFSLDRVHI